MSEFKQLLESILNESKTEMLTHPNNYEQFQKNNERQERQPVTRVLRQAG